jgi:hypothetical protein
MPEKNKKLPIFGHEVDVAEVPIVKSDEQINTYWLEDGSVIRVRTVATSILRVEGHYLPDGSPIYIVMATPVTNVVESKIKGEPKQEKVKPN